MKRFTDTAIWQKPWFRKLSPAVKCLWRFLCDHCDHAGVIEIDWEVVSIYVGQSVSEADLSLLNGNIIPFKGKHLIPGYIAFQYGRLSPECKPHVPVYEALEKHGLLESDTLPDILRKAINGLSKDYPVLQEKEKEKEKDKEGGCKGDAASYPSDFEQFWSAYPRKVGKGAAFNAWKRCNRPLLATTLAAVEAQKKTEQWQKDGGQFIPHPATWLNQRRWEDRVETYPTTPKAETVADQITRELDRNSKRIAREYGVL